MNISVVVEGSVGEKQVYREWIPCVNPTLTYVYTVAEIHENNFAIVSGFGYPYYFGVISDAIEDTNQYLNINRLVICVDAEDFTYDQKFQEISDYISSKNCRTEVRIVIQYFCFETWALGNRRIGPHHPQSDILRTYRNYFNVLDEDPESMPGYPPEDLNRSQFAAKYLKKALNEKHVTYTKQNPSYIKDPSYFRRIKERYMDTDHIRSFEQFLAAFV